MEEAVSAEEELDTDSVESALKNLNIEMAGTEEEAVKGLEASLSMEV